MQPYATNNAAPLLWLNPNSWQIISAGKDGVFGVNGTAGVNSVFNPSQGLGGGTGADDQTNFSPRKLGAPAN